MTQIMEHCPARLEFLPDPPKERSAPLIIDVTYYSRYWWDT